jgi:hypothetical protein
MPVSRFHRDGGFGGESLLLEAIDAYAAAASLLGYFPCAAFPYSRPVIAALDRQDGRRRMAQNNIVE